MKNVEQQHLEHKSKNSFARLNAAANRRKKLVYILQKVYLSNKITNHFRYHAPFSQCFAFSNMHIHSLHRSRNIFFHTKNHSLQLDGFSCYCRAITNSIYILHYIFVSHFCRYCHFCTYLHCITALEFKCRIHAHHQQHQHSRKKCERETKRKKSVKMFTAM